MPRTGINSDDLKRKVVKWAESIGRKKAEGRLISEGLSFSLAYQLTKGEYFSDPKERVIELIEKAMGSK